MKIRSIIFSSFILTFCFSLFASEPAVLTLIKKKYNQNSTIQSQLDLNIYWSVREKSEQKSGTLVLAPQNCFKIELNGETFVSNGQLLWHYNKSIAQVTIDKLSKVDVSSLPSNIFKTYLTQYSYTVKQKSDSEVILEWKKTAQDNSIYDSITIWAVEKSGVVNKIQTVDRNGNINTYTFRNTIFGGKISGKVFDFQVPKNVQVLNNDE